MTPWEVIEEALNHKRPRRNAQWLAEQLGLSIQVVSNWKQRGSVPPARYRAIANALGITLDQLEGIEPLPWLIADESAWPFQRVKLETIQSLDHKHLAQLEEAMEDVLDRLRAQPSREEVEMFKTAVNAKSAKTTRRRAA
jgi:transcriptional regulator with XRE-family HTH domain